MHNMGMRQVPIGERDCHAFDFMTMTWRQLPDLPQGRLHPTLIPINTRFLFQIGGFEDINFDVFRFDMQNSHKPWKTITLDLTRPIIDRDMQSLTRSYLEQRIKIQGLEERASEDDSDVQPEA